MSRPHEEPVDGRQAGPILEIRRLAKSFRGSAVFECADLAVEEGETIAIIGPSGAGKSTLLRCIAGVESVDAGVRLFAGRPLDINKGRESGGGGAIGLIFQDRNLFPHMTALQNVALAPRRARGLPKHQAHELATRLLTQVGLADRLHHYPAELSGGQQQRVAIARAIATDPRVLLYDEPTASLDPLLSESVLESMRTLAQSGMTSIVVTHELEFARSVASRVVFVGDGRIIESGTPEQIFTAPTQPETAAFVSSSFKRHDD